MSLSVVINVDDLGLHPAVRRAVRELGAAGAVTSATLLANGPDLAEAARVTEADLGVHLNIMRGRPLSPPETIPSLVDGRGLFPGSFTAILKAYLTRRLDPAQAEAEWARQIERVLDLGVRPSHLDSEKHVHALPGLMAAVQRLARRYGVPWVRRQREAAPWTRWDKGGLRVRFLNLCALGHRPLPEVAWPDAVWGVADQGEALLPGRFEQAMQRLKAVRRGQTPAGIVVEIVCHPGRPEPGDPPLPAEFGPMRVAAQWRAEYDRLSDPGWSEALRRLGARAVGYAGLDPVRRAR
ncbi:MAG: ChbG/HpnK family deacetylase [Desulfovibrionaceae bacterium]